MKQSFPYRSNTYSLGANATWRDLVRLGDNVLTEAPYEWAIRSTRASLGWGERRTISSTPRTVSDTVGKLFVHSPQSVRMIRAVLRPLRTRPTGPFCPSSGSDVPSSTYDRRWSGFMYPAWILETIGPSIRVLSRHAPNIIRAEISYFRTPPRPKLDTDGGQALFTKQRWSWWRLNTLTHYIRWFAECQKISIYF